MESENCVIRRDERGEYTVHAVKDPAGNSYEIVKRDCGDYVEIAPRGTFINHGGIKLTQFYKESFDEQRPKEDRDPNSIWLSVPEIVFKFPKNLPEDMTERAKVYTQIQYEAVIRIATYIIEAYKIKSAANANAMASNPHQVKDEVKKLCEEFRNLLNVL